jgi:Protein of unknown function (DUF3107)
VDVRIGVTNAPRELALELADSTDLSSLRGEIDRALGTEGAVLWLTDRRGKQIGVPVAKIAFIEIGSPDGERRIGFGG